MKKMITRITDIGLYGAFFLAFFSGSLVYYWNYYRVPEDKVALSAFEALRIDDREAARDQFHNAIGPCLQEVFQQEVGGRYQSYIADFNFVATDPTFANSPVKLMDAIQNITDREGNNYNDILLVDITKPNMESRKFEMLMAKFAANPGDMALYNCLLRFTPDNAQAANNSLALSIETAQWDLRPQN